MEFIYGIVLGISFILGIKVGIGLNKDIVRPSIVEKIKTIKIEKEAKKDKLNTILDNIDNYDGTGRNQKKVGV